MQGLRLRWCDKHQQAEGRKARHSSIALPGWFGSHRDVHEFISTLSKQERDALAAPDFPADIGRELALLDLSDDDRAIVWRRNTLVGVFGPGKFVVWKWPRDVRVESFNVSSSLLRPFDRVRLLAISDAAALAAWVRAEGFGGALLAVRAVDPGRMVDQSRDPLSRLAPLSRPAHRQAKAGSGAR